MKTTTKCYVWYKNINFGDFSYYLKYSEQIKIKYEKFSSFDHIKTSRT